jgi:hypothetical protein
VRPAAAAERVIRLTVTGSHAFVLRAVVRFTRARVALASLVRFRSARIKLAFVLAILNVKYYRVLILFIVRHVSDVSPSLVFLIDNLNGFEELSIYSFV